MDFLDVIAKMLGLSAGRKLERTCTQNYVPVKDILEGVIVLDDGRYIKILEIEPSNFEMKVPQEQEGILHQYYGWLRTAPANFQIKCITKAANVESYLAKARAALQIEKNENCKRLIANYINALQQNSHSYSVEHHFYLIFEHEETGADKFFQRNTQEDIIYDLNRTALQIESALTTMGNRIVR